MDISLKNIILENVIFFTERKKNLKKDIITNISDKETYIEKCQKIMNSSIIYDRCMFKESFKKIYNDSRDKYNFSLNDNFLSNIISKWKNNTYRFKKECVFYHSKDYENPLILREFRLIPIETDNKEKNKYIIWGNSENIMRLKVSKNIFINGIFHHPPGYYQLLIII